MSDPIRVGGGYWTCEKCGEEYHASNIHECAEPSRVPSTEQPKPRYDRDGLGRRGTRPTEQPSEYLASLTPDM
jgi:hypothetical protein